MKKIILAAICLYICIFPGRSATSAGIWESKDARQPDRDIMLVRVDSTGHIVWRKGYSCKGINICQAAIPTRDGKVALLGFKRQSRENISSFMLMIVDTSGVETWNRYYKPISSLWPIQCMDIVQLHDSRYIIAGVSGHDSADIWMMCISENGEPLWNRSYVMPNRGSGHDCSLTPILDGGFILAGSLAYTDSSTGALKPIADVHMDGWILKTDSTGNKLWMETYGSKTKDYFVDVIESSDGTLWALGERSRTDTALIPSDAWIAQVNREGRIIKERIIESGYHTELHTIEAIPDSAYILAGDIWDGNQNDPFLVKISSKGDRLWSRTYSKSKNIAIRSALSQSNGYLLAGYIFIDGIQLWDSYFMMVDLSGQQILAWSYGCGECSSFADIIAIPGGYILAGEADKSCSDSLWTITKR